MCCSSPFAIADVDLKAWRSQLDVDSQAQLTAHVAIETILTQRTQAIDDCLASLWQQSGLSDHALCCVATGGYGRSEPFPHSDLDLLILGEESITSQCASAIDHFLQQLWDLKWTIGHSVHSQRSLFAAAKTDLVLMTSLLDARFLVGDHALFERCYHTFLAQPLWTFFDFFNAKKQEQQQRHHHYQNTLYHVEPDLKQSLGGLRDLQMIHWLERYATLWPHTSSNNAAISSVTNAEEANELRQSEHFLWRLRFALHLQLPRSDNRLLFDRQMALAQQLGYSGEGNHPAEQMMRDFFVVAKQIHEVGQMQQRFIDDSFAKNVTQEPLNDDFEIRKIESNYYLHLRSPHYLTHHPEALITLFSHFLEDSRLSDLSAETVLQLRQAKRQFKGALADHATARHHFLAMLTHPHGIQRALSRLHQYGVLPLYLPDWQPIVGLMQFDHYHAYTVDEHTLRLLLEMERLQTHREAMIETLTDITIVDTLQNVPLAPLRIAGLYHDLGKGQQCNHSEKGAELVTFFCQQHGIDETTTTLASQLIRSHLQLSNTAQRRDIDDIDTIKQFTEHVNTTDQLDALYLLTIADIRATHPKLWSSWRQGLIQQLYRTARHYLTADSKTPLNVTQRIMEQQAASIPYLSSVYDSQRLRHFWQTFSEDYFLRYSPQQIAWHTDCLIDQPIDHTAVKIHSEAFHDGSEIMFYTTDRPSLFTQICQMLYRKNIQIHQAIITTTPLGQALDTFTISTASGHRLAKEQTAALETYFINALAQPYTELDLKNAFLPKPKRQIAPKVTFTTAENGQSTYLRIVTVDRPGLLVQISALFTRSHFVLANANITTVNGRVEDDFTLSTQDRRALTSAQHSQLKRDLLKLLR